MAQKLGEKLPEEFVSKTAIYDYKAPATEAIQKVHSFGAVVVEKGKKYYGIVDSRSLSKHKKLALAKSTPIGEFAQQVPILDKSTSLESAIQYFFNSSKKALPYSAGGNKVTGIVKRDRILSSILSMHLLGDYTVTDAMTSPVIAIDENATVAQAVKTMQDHKINKIVVLSKGKVMGVLTRRDILSANFSPAERSPKLTRSTPTESYTQVGSICEKNFYSIEKSKLVDNAIRSLLENKISSLLVTDNGRPVGIISTRDIFEIVVANSSVKENKVVLSGLDENTKEFETEILDEMNLLVDKLSKFHKIKIEYLALNVKRPKSKNYEIRARLVSTKKGTFAVGATGYSLDSVIKDVSDKLYKEVKSEKDMIVTGIRERDAENYE